MTLKAYDELCDRLRANEYQCGNWWPSISDLEKYVEPNPEKYIEFLIWIVETAKDPVTDEDKESKKRINRILRHTIKIKDDESYEEAR